MELSVSVGHVLSAPAGAPCDCEHCDRDKRRYGHDDQMRHEVYHAFTVLSGSCQSIPCFQAPLAFHLNDNADPKKVERDGNRANDPQEGDLPAKNFIEKRKDKYEHGSFAEEFCTAIDQCPRVFETHRPHHACICIENALYVKYILTWRAIAPSRGCIPYLSAERDRKKFA